MAQTPPTVSQRKEAVDALSQDDRLWLAERLVEYKNYSISYAPIEASFAGHGRCIQPIGQA